MINPSFWTAFPRSLPAHHHVSPRLVSPGPGAPPKTPVVFPLRGCEKIPSPACAVGSGPIALVTAVGICCPLQRNLVDHRPRGDPDRGQSDHFIDDRTARPQRIWGRALRTGRSIVEPRGGARRPGSCPSPSSLLTPFLRGRSRVFGPGATSGERSGWSTSRDISSWASPCVLDRPSASREWHGKRSHGRARRADARSQLAGLHDRAPTWPRTGAASPWSQPS